MQMQIDLDTATKAEMQKLMLIMKLMATLTGTDMFHECFGLLSRCDTASASLVS